MPFSAFVLATTKFGTLIVNRFDHHEPEDGWSSGVGAEILEFGEYAPEEALQLFCLMQFRRQLAGDGVVVVDCGANIGAHTVNWAQAMRGWGSVVAIEAQERVFYALAGNIALNNCFNAKAIHAAVGSFSGMMRIPQLDHTRPANFAGLHLRPTDRDPGQAVSYDSGMTMVNAITIDRLGLERVDLIKIDVESMEPEVLEGARETITKQHPIVYAEHNLCGIDNIKSRLPGYEFRLLAGLENNVLCVHEDDLRLLK